MNHEDIHHIKSELKQAIRDEVLSVKASLKQDMDIRNEMLTNKVVVLISTEIKELLKEEIKPLQLQVIDNTAEIRFAKRLGYMFATFVAFVLGLPKHLWEGIRGLF